jgi:hypothetical protein
MPWAKAVGVIDLEPNPTSDLRFLSTHYRKFSTSIRSLPD